MKNKDMPAMPVSSHELAAALELGADELKGLTKREMFAMHSMQGLLSGGVQDFIASACRINDGSPDSVVAKMSAEIADALLEELEK